jgi:hypothetical protein
MPDTQPQFSTANYSQTDSVERCASCKSPVGATYYRVNGALACESCAKKVGGTSPKDSHTAFMRALLFGFGGAIAGLAIYSFVGIVTGLELGIVAIAVGWIVAKAMKAGSGGVGGRRYQIAAVLFTYFAVSMSAIPMGIAYYAKNRDERRAQQAALQKKAQDNAQRDAAGAANAETDRHPEADDSEDGVPARPQKSRASLIVGLVLQGLVSPFTQLNSGAGGLIGLLILFFGMQIAWKLTGTSVRATAVLGPFTQNDAAPAAAAPSSPPPPLG